MVSFALLINGFALFANEAYIYFLLFNFITYGNID